MAKNTTETMLNKENEKEAEYVMDFLKELEPGEKKEFLTLIQGIRFAKNFKTA